MQHPFLLISPYPTISEDGVLADGILLEQDSFCATRCAKECRLYTEPPNEAEIKFYTCPRKFHIVVFSLRDTIVRINGVIETTRSTPEARKLHKHRKLKEPQLRAWISTLCRMQPQLDQAVATLARDSIHALHDIKSIIGTILSTAEAWVWDQSGRSLDDKLASSPEPLKRIYQSTQILSSLLQLTDIITNPESATFGEPRPMVIVNLLFLMKKLFEDKARARNIDIIIRTSSNRSVRVYNSIILIPLTLIDNAVKHSDGHSQILIKIDDLPAGDVRVDISSSGTLVPVEERDLIFHRAKRGTNAKAKGSGLGLHIAQIVARANGSLISYTADAFMHTGAKGFNHFAFTLHPNIDK